MRDSKLYAEKHKNMCKSICFVVTWLIFFIISLAILLLSTNYILLYYYPEAIYEGKNYNTLQGYNDFSSEMLRNLEVCSLVLAGTGLLLIYLQFTVKLLLCTWIIVFVLAEIEIFVLILIDAVGKWNVLSIIHVFHSVFVIYSLTLVLAKYRNLKYSIKDSTCQRGQEEQ